MPNFTLSCDVNISPQAFWVQQSFETINHELSPWIQMSAPSAWRELRLKDWPGGQALFKSWIMLLGWVPIDRHAFGSISFKPDSGFVEISSSWINSAWRHERFVESTGNGCHLTDRVTFAPRLPPMTPLLKAIYLLVFRHRHRRLRARYAAHGHHRST